MTNYETVKQDIWDWIKNYIEANHKFYDYKFPPCPYARAARINGQVDVSVYQSGGVIEFIKNQVDQLTAQSDLKTRVIVFPARMHYYFWLPMMIRRLNKKVIALDYYLQYGTAIRTTSAYDELLKNKPYFIVVVNKLSTVLDGHASLLKTDYYKPWAKHHYTAVVTNRQKLYEKYRKETQ
jgi:hypothetical protein